MRIGTKEIHWLDSFYPGLQYDAESRQISGEIEFCATFDRLSGNLIIGGLHENADMDTFIHDAFHIAVELAIEDGNGWPKVYEVGGRHEAISERQGVPAADLHFMSDGQCCLGISYGAHRNLSLETFVEECLIPFLYRLAYADKFDVASARRDLWGEYPHGDEGYREYEREMMRIAYRNTGRNRPCPCGSGKKYKQCHLDQAEAVKRRL